MGRKTLPKDTVSVCSLPLPQYNISEESFFKPLKNVVSKLKLRGSWGLVGNDQINGSRFIYMSQIDLGGKGFTTGVNQNVTYNGPVYQRYANEDITWEVGEKINFGVDLQLFHSLDLTFDIFRENRRDIFQEKGTTPTYMGTATTKVYGNLAAMRNQGFELAAAITSSSTKTGSSASKELSHMRIMKSPNMTNRQNIHGSQKSESVPIRMPFILPTDSSLMQRILPTTNNN